MLLDMVHKKTENQGINKLHHADRFLAPLMGVLHHWANTLPNPHT